MSEHKCPKCGEGKTRVIDSRPTRGGTRRRRVCDRCHGRITTIELETVAAKRVNLFELQAEVRALLDAAVALSTKIEQMLRDREEDAPTGRNPTDIASRVPPGTIGV